MVIKIWGGKFKPEVMISIGLTHNLASFDLNTNKIEPPNFWGLMLPNAWNRSKNESETRE